jgi:hypothetical protein
MRMLCRGNGKCYTGTSRRSQTLIPKPETRNPKPEILAWQVLYEYLEAYGKIEFEQFEIATNLPKVVYSDRNITLGRP